MQIESKACLEDIRCASEQIFEFINGKDFSSYKENLMLKSAVERQFEIIGEALNRLDKRDPQMTAEIQDYQKIISFRNILIHGYDIVEDRVVWDIILKYLPNLYEHVTYLLK